MKTIKKKTKKLKTLKTTMKHQVQKPKAIRKRKSGQSPVLRRTINTRNSGIRSGKRSRAQSYSKAKKEELSRRAEEISKRQSYIGPEVDKANAKNLDGYSVPYSDNIKKREQNIRKNVEIVEYDAHKAILAAEKKKIKMIEEDNQLNGYYKSNIQNVPDSKAIEVAAQWTHELRQNRKKMKKNKKGKKSEGDSVKTMEERKAELVKTETGSTRVQIMPNFTGLSDRTVPVYCDITKEAKKVKIPKTLLSRYTDKNVHRDPEIAKLEAFFQEDTHMIKCDCHGRKPIVKCWENPDCPCYQKNVQLAKLQLVALSPLDQHRTYGPTKFNTFGPLLMNLGQDHQTIGFACSEECGCKGSCTNNVTLMLEKSKKLFPLVLERKNATIGFQLSNLNAIPFGTVITHFSGEITNFTYRDHKNNDYIHKCYEPKYGNFGAMLSKLVKDEWPKDLKALMTNAYNKTWYIDPKLFGNIARMFNHHCDPNVVLVRVYQKGFAPSQMILVAVTTRDVFPPEALCIDYGEGYLKYLGGCHCGTLSCEYTPFEDLTVEEIKKRITEERVKRVQEYYKTIVPQLKSKSK